MSNAAAKDKANVNDNENAGVNFDVANVDDADDDDDKDDDDDGGVDDNVGMATMMIIVILRRKLDFEIKIR